MAVFFEATRAEELRLVRDKSPVHHRKSKRSTLQPGESQRKKGVQQPAISKKKEEGERMVEPKFHGKGSTRKKGKRGEKAEKEELLVRRRKLQLSRHTKKVP